MLIKTMRYVKILKYMHLIIQLIILTIVYMYAHQLEYLKSIYNAKCLYNYSLICFNKIFRVIILVNKF